MKRFSFVFAVGIHHMNDSSFCNRTGDGIEKEYDKHKQDCLNRMRVVDEVEYYLEGFVFFPENLNKRVYNLVRQEYEEPNDSEKRWEKIEFFQRWKFFYEFPCPYDNVFFF